MSVIRPRGAVTRWSRPTVDLPQGSQSHVPPGSRWAALARASRGDPRIYRRLAILLAAAALAFSVAPVVNQHVGRQNKDYNLWYETGRTYLRGGDIYPTDHRPFPFMYPPAAAALLAITSVAGERLFVYALLAANTTAWVGSILLSVKLATGSALRQRPILYALPTLCVIPFVHDMYLLGQPNLFLLFLMLGAFAALRSGRGWAAGALVALAAGIKAFPVLAVGYLVYRRRWGAVASTVLTLAALLWALPAVFRGPEKAWSDLSVWTRGMVLKYDEGQIAQRPERCYSFKNQSLVAVSNRLLRSIPADGESKDGWQINVADLSFRTVNAAAAAAGLALGLFYLATMPLAPPRSGRAEAAETAMLLLMILVFSPFAFNYFYVWLIFPLTVALDRLLGSGDGTRERRVWRLGLLAALALYAASALSLRTSQAYGNLLAVNLLLLGLLGWSLVRERSSAAALPAEG